MRILKIIWFYITWIFYFAITLEDRNAYELGKLHGVDVVDYDRKCGILFDDLTIKYKKNSIQQRRYLNFKEYKESNYPNKGGE